MDIETGNKIFLLNLFSNVLHSIINMSVMFFLTPFLTNTLGSEAFGFVGLANNMINYLSIITVALNSVAGRFISIKIHENKINEAQVYYNSVFWMNLILAILIALITVPVICNIDFLIKIPKDLVVSVKLLFFFVFINYELNIIANIFTTSTFVTNKLYLTNLGNCISGFIRVLFLLIVFSFLPIKVYYVGIASLLATIFISIYNVVVTSKLLPFLQLNPRIFSFNVVKLLFLSGIWTSLIRLTQILSDGLDLLIGNIGISATAMGVLSIAYTVPNIAGIVIGSIINVFSPKQTYYFAKNDMDNVIKEIKTNMKLCGFITSIIFAGIVTYGFEFYSLYVPGQNIHDIYIITLIRLLTLLICGVASSLDNVFLLTNHLKVNSIAWFIYSVICVITTLVLVKFTNLGIYAIAGVSKVLSFLMYLTYVPIYASKCLNISWKSFYPQFGKYLINTFIVTVIFLLSKKILPDALSIPMFCLDIILIGILGIIYNYFLYLNKTERLVMIETCKKINKKFLRK